MKNEFLVFSITIFLASCSIDQASSDVTSKRILLSEKKEKLKKLQVEINKLNNEILLLDPPKDKELLPVSSMRIGPTNFKRKVEVQANVENQDIVNASSQIGGIITANLVKEGQYVKKGQLIAKIDDKILKNQKTELETNIQLAKDLYQRQESLWKQNIGSEIQYLQLKNNYERLLDQRNTIETQISKSNVYAPISGVIDKKFLLVGELVNPGSPIVTIFDPNKLKVVADVPEAYLGKISSRSPVDIAIPVLNITKQTFVTSIGRTIDPSNRTFTVEINTNNINGALKPNLLATIQFVDNEQNDVLLIPLHLVQEEINGNKFVYIVNSTEGKKKAKKVFIEIGDSYDGKVIVHEGLKEGDYIINKGARNLSDGDPIAIIENEDE